MRIRCAFVCEANLAVISERNPRFVRAVEHSHLDGALVIDADLANSLPTSNETDKLFSLLEQKEGSRQKLLLPLDFKSFSWTLVSHGGRGMVKGRVYVQPEQTRHCHALVIGNLVDPEYVAVVPYSPYCNIKWVEGQDERGRQWDLGEVVPTMTQFNPFPAALSPLVMHERHLSQFYDNLIARQLDPSVPL